MTTSSASFGSSLFDHRLDAIVVPTNRSAECLSYALELAGATNAFLLILGSGHTSAMDVAKRITSHGIRGLAVDVPADYRHPLLLDFETDNFSDAMLGRSTNDISLKRNLGLILARMAGWRNILFLDDDITNIKGIDQAINFTADESVAGFLVSEFPDNSVVSHAERLSGVEPGVRLNGGALMVNLEATPAFFPNIYNEDWLFLCGIGRQAFCSTAVGTAEQKRYDPFASPLRATSEEFGDLMAEGIEQLINAGLDCLQSSKSDWRQVLAERKLLLEQIHNRLKMQTNMESRRARNSLAAAEARLKDIVPKSCVDYLAAWDHDLSLFRERFALLPLYMGPMVEAVEAIGLKSTRQMLTLKHNVV